MTNFTGQNTKRLTIADYRRVASIYGLQVAHVQAVVRVEAGNAGFWNSGNLKLLYEGHIAYRETSGDLRAKLVAAGLAWRSWGDVSYGKASQSRARLSKAIKIAGDQAYRWASYGLGQTMGFNAEVCGYSSAKEMFEAYLTGEPAQLDGMMRFIKGNNLLSALRNNDWRTFARGYNGSGYAKHGYHTRLQKAYNQFASGKPQISVNVPDPWADGILTIGDKGPIIEDLQRRLGDIEVDGHFGRATAEAVKKFQRAKGLAADGIVGAKTKEALEEVGSTTSSSAVGPVIVAAGTVGLLTWLSNLPCEYLNLFCGG